MTPLSVGTRVDREDGRFYVPIIQTSTGKILARVASDAFDEDEERATKFALGLTTAFNEFSV